MPDKFKNKYQIPSARAPWWDYRREEAYFVTICTRSRKHYFGEIHNGQMQLSGEDRLKIALLNRLNIKSPPLQKHWRVKVELPGIEPYLFFTPFKSTHNAQNHNI